MPGQQASNKTAIVTGSGSGIGLEFSRLLLQQGANVLFADIALRPEAEKLINGYQSPSTRAVFVKTDVTSWSDLNAMFDAAEEHFGSVDIVCPGAGIFEPHWSNFWHPPGSSESKDDALSGRYKILDLNLTHPIRVTQMAISRFLSASPPITTIMFPLYCVSKHGTQAFVRCLGDLEKTNGIRVTAVDPGIVKTPIWLEHPEKLQLVDQENDGWVTPEDVAKVMLACVEDYEIESGVEGEEPIPIHGGSCLEILAGGLRDVPLFNNPGPFASGRKAGNVSHSEKLENEVLRLLKPGWGVL
ncbi:hypothetical protein LTR37_014770 [Vermiconidia calcicola]|uniref:Uncharacterized protein n=1 Tax=Vermiconidia calcicola TaxID=1690605 RepID=A0ACC3MSP8_9PEZI|nr:hypothetical protein LTR37_014770 [Vermiconidia calcicola]